MDDDSKIYSDFTYSCKGIVIFNDIKATIDCRFKFYLLDNGVIKGFIELNDKSPGNFLNNSFNLKGEDDKYNWKVELIHCSCEKITEDFSNHQTKIRFRCRESFLRKPEELRTLTDSIRITFGIKGMYPVYPNIYTVPLTIETDLGNLQIAHHENATDMEKGISTIFEITSALILEIRTLDNIDFNTMLEKSKDIVEKILNLTSFGQGSYHDWTFIHIARVGPEKTIPIYMEWNTNHFDNLIGKRQIIKFTMQKFLSECYPKYTSDFNANTGFSDALHWYLQSVHTSVIQFKYLYAFVCLELLLYRYDRKNDSEFLIDAHLFKKVRPKIEDYLSKILKEKGIDTKKRDKMYRKLGDLNREPFGDRLTGFLDKFGIRYDNLVDNDKMNMNELISIRDSIVHTGSSTYGPDRFDDLLEAYIRLLHIVLRIFLSILGYKGSYSMPYEAGKNFEYSDWSSIPMTAKYP